MKAKELFAKAQTAAVSARILLNAGDVEKESNTAIYHDFVTGSEFSPYVTTVGLYDEAQNLLAVAKLAQPLPSSPTTDTTILISLDR